MKVNLLAQGLSATTGKQAALESDHLPPQSNPKDLDRRVDLLRRLDQLSKSHNRLSNRPISTAVHRKVSQIPRYVFTGDQVGDSEIRFGVFAGLRPDDNAGPKAVAAFIGDLVAFPSLGSAFRVYAYPTVNSSGFESEAPLAQSGRFLIDQSGRMTNSSEAYLIERELSVVQFHGLVVIHVVDNINAIQVGVSGADSHKTLLPPIVFALESALPAVEPLVVSSSWSLTADVDLKRRPFELVLRIPSFGSENLYSIALRVALHTAIDRYRSYLAYANNI
jgi:hypothetical protein